jgi:hypothetical protein
MTRNRYAWRVLVLIVLTAFRGSQAIAQDDLTEDGLQQAEGLFNSQYWKPGAGFSQYRRIAILDCYVEFQENWLRDQNRGKMSFNKVSEEDMEFIKQRLGELFVETFSESLQEEHSYQISEAVRATDLLLLRPAIFELQISPDTFGSQALLPDTSNTSMTLYLEFYDSATSVLVGRVIDVEVESQKGQPGVRRMLGRWASEVGRTLSEM